MRSSHLPARRRTSTKLANAAVREPKCSGPVGEGANRPTGESGGEEGVSESAAGDLFFTNLVERLTVDAELCCGTCFKAADADFDTALVTEAVVVIF